MTLGWCCRTSASRSIFESRKSYVNAETTMNPSRSRTILSISTVSGLVLKTPTAGSAELFTTPPRSAGVQSRRLHQVFDERKLRPGIALDYVERTRWCVWQFRQRAPAKNCLEARTELVR